MSRRLRSLLDRADRSFSRGGRLEQYRAPFEWFDSLLYSSGEATRGSPHARDAVNVQRIMAVIVVALLPAALVGMWNTGLQANLAIASLGFDSIDGWRASVLALLGAGNDAGSVYDNFVHGFLYFLPVYVVAILFAGAWETLFAAIRNSEVNEGLAVTALIYTLILPASVPLWQAALGISFGVVIGKEVFGGTGKNFLNPALLGWSFLFFAYPDQLTGNAVWVPVDGYTGATALALAAGEGLTGVTASGVSWWQAFLGSVPGSLGATSTAACLVGALVLIYSKLASWRIIIACCIGLLLPTLLFSGAGNPMLDLPAHWHLVLGGFAFGAIFIATDPVSSPDTLAGHWVYGILIGIMTWIIRVINPSFPEGIGLAILFGSVVAPTIDYVVIRANIRRRKKRYD